MIRPGLSQENACDVLSLVTPAPVIAEPDITVTRVCIVVMALLYRLYRQDRIPIDFATRVDTAPQNQPRSVSFNDIFSRNIIILSQYDVFSICR